MRSSVSKYAKRAKNGSHIYDKVTKVDIHPSVGLSPIAF